jgi:hypothetical protein
MTLNNSLEIVLRLVDNTYEPADQKGTYSLKASMHNNNLVLKFATIVHFAGENPMQPQTKQSKEHAVHMFNETIKKLKKDYKEETGQTLKINPLAFDCDYELIHATASSLRRVAYFKAMQTYEIV